MIDGVRIKVCGLTSLVDAEFADRCGADYFGFNFYPKSPRYITPAQYRAMAPRLPERRKVAVLVEPTAGELGEYRELGLDYFQIHYRQEIGATRVREWSEFVGAKQLWLAPKLPPGEEISPDALAAAKFMLVDGFAADKFGGTGKTSDWEKFARLQAAHPDHFWILSGGLSPANIADAIAATEASFVDVNSGIESAPGVKDPEKLKAFIVALHKARTRA